MIACEKSGDFVSNDKDASAASVGNRLTLNHLHPELELMVRKRDGIRTTCA